MSDATLSQYDQDFAHAMALKLRLNRKQKLINKYGEFRVTIAEQTCEEHPKADLEEVIQMMEEAGFWYGGFKSHISGYPRKDAAAEVSIDGVLNTDGSELEKF
jgi:hypothetical protein